MKTLWRIGACLAAVTAITAVTAVTAAAGATDRDTPQDYTHLLPLTASARQGVLQLRLPRAVYLHARSPQLDDVRVFDANGVPQPFALRMPAVEARIGHQDVPVRIFPLMGAGSAATQLDLDVSTAPDGRLLSVKVRPERSDGQTAPAPRLTGLVLDLGRQVPSTTTPATAPAINALRFTLPADRRDYSAQVWLETSDDLKRWDAVGTAELNWLTNQDAQTLANDRLDFHERSFRYARLTWRSGTPLQFAAIVAEQPVRTALAPAGEQLLVPAVAGEHPQDLVYAVPAAIAPDKLGLQFDQENIVLPALLGVYQATPRRPGTPATRYFEPVLNTTFYRITQDGHTRSSGDLDVTPRHAPQWVLRSATASTVKPQLRLGWQPATLVFLASGHAPYTLAVGRVGAAAGQRPLEQVAPGFSDAELRGLERATTGPVQANAGAAASAAAATQDAAASARNRLLVLWGVLLLGTGMLAWMVWRLLRPQPPR